MTRPGSFVTPGPLMALAALVGLALTGCRDATAPPASTRQNVGATDGRVTFSLADDRTPVWSPEGDSLYYVTEGTAPFAEGPGLLAAISLETRGSGSLRPDIQAVDGLPVRARDPVPSPNGSELAFVELVTVLPPALCRLGVRILCTRDVDPVSPRIARVRLRVRGRDAAPGAQDLDRADLRIEGPDLEPTFPPGFPATYQIRFFPFQEEFIREGGVPFGPSFSPDGGRVVVSDGLRLHVWDRAAGELVRLQGGEGGLRPRWSPGGDRIAFTRELRGDSIQVFCEHKTPPESDFGVCRQFRWIYLDVQRHVALVPATGGQAEILWEGREVAWHPDGRRLVFVRDEALWLGSAEGGEPVRIPGTDGAREPAVSPGGGRIAFARKGGLTHDIWVIPFPEG